MRVYVCGVIYFSLVCFLCVFPVVSLVCVVDRRNQDIAFQYQPGSSIVVTVRYFYAANYYINH